MRLAVLIARSVVLLALTLYALGRFVSATFEVGMLDASPWPMFGWLVVAYLPAFALRTWPAPSTESNAAEES